MGQSVLIQKMHCCTENSHEEVVLTLITGDFVSRLLGRTGVEPSWPAALSGIVPSKTYSVKLPFNYYEPIAKFPRGTCCLLHFQPTLINEIQNPLPAKNWILMFRVEQRYYCGGFCTGQYRSVWCGLVVHLMDHLVTTGNEQSPCLSIRTHRTDSSHVWPPWQQLQGK